MGVIIDDKLTWTEHIKCLVNKISSLIGILYRQNHLFPIQCRRNIYFALVYSNLIYCIEIYANVPKASLDPLIKKCNSLLRVLQNKPRRTHTYELYTSFNTLPINLLFKLYTLKLIHRCIYDGEQVPNVIRNIFIQGSAIHTHKTRLRNNFILQNTICHKSLAFYGPSMWNSIPISLQNITSLSIFIKHCKMYLQNDI